MTNHLKFVSIPTAPLSPPSHVSGSHSATWSCDTAQSLGSDSNQPWRKSDSNFLSSAPRLLQSSQASPVCPSRKSNMWMKTSTQHRWKDTNTGKPKLQAWLSLLWGISSVLTHYQVVFRRHSVKELYANRALIQIISKRKDVCDRCSGFAAIVNKWHLLALVFLLFSYKPNVTTTPRQNCKKSKINFLIFLRHTEECFKYKLYNLLYLHFTSTNDHFMWSRSSQGRKQENSLS